MPGPPDMNAMPAMPVGSHMPGMYAPPADAHSLLTAWPVSMPGVVALGLALWAGSRAWGVWRQPEPRSPARWLLAGVSLLAGIAGVTWVVSTPHGSPFAYVMTGVEVLAARSYLAGVRRLVAKGRRWPAFRTAMFLAGLVSIGIALQSPVATLVATSFEYHVVQHMLLMVVAAPMLALSAPMTLALQTTSRPTKSTLLAVLKSRTFGALTFPVTVWFLYYGVMFLFFATPLIGYAMNHMVVMDALNIAFLIGACMFWWPTVGIDKNPRWEMSHGMRIVNLLIGVPFESFLGIALMSGGAAASMYSVGQTHTGGGMLWGIGEVSAFVGTAIVMVQWVRDDERAAIREDRRTAARQRAEAAHQSEGTGTGDTVSTPAVDAPSSGSAYEEAYRLRGIPVPITLSDDYRG